MQAKVNVSKTEEEEELCSHLDEEIREEDGVVGNMVALRTAGRRWPGLRQFSLLVQSPLERE